ncbi:MAG TPA: sigma-70 family RNA polymerase sigma factor [Oculatellaceae cyanobacterium]
MALLPSKSNNYPTSTSTVLADLKKGDKEKRNEFVWTHQERFYAIAYAATGDAEHATNLCIIAFQNVFLAIDKLKKGQVNTAVWDWLAPFIVDACAEWHQQNSRPVTPNPRTDPSADGSAQMDWETTIILGAQRVKRCISSLPAEQQKVFILRHHFQLTYDQIGTVINEAPEDVMAWLLRARVQIVKCLGRG